MPMKQRGEKKKRKNFTEVCSDFLIVLQLRIQFLRERTQFAEKTSKKKVNCQKTCFLRLTIQLTQKSMSKFVEKQPYFDGGKK